MSVAAVDTGRREIEAIALVGFGHGVSHFFHLMIPPLFPWLIAEFGLSYTEVGALTAVFFAVSGVGQAAAGFVVDHLGARRVLFAGMGMFALAGLTLAAAPNYLVLLLAAALAGLGNCVFHPADFTLLNRNVSPPRLGYAFSAHGLSGNLGWAAAPIFMTGMTIAFHWRVAAVGAAALALLALGALWLRRDTIAESTHRVSAKDSAEPPVSTFAFLGSSAVWMCFLFFLFVTMAIAAQQNFGPSVLNHVYGMSAVASASALTALLLGGAAGVATGGYLVTRYASHDRLIAIVLVLAAVLALLLATGGVPVWSVTALMAGIGFFGGLAGPSRDMLVRRAAISRFGNRAFGRVYGFVYSGLDVGFGLSPLLLFGPLMDAGRFKTVLVAAAVSQGLAVLTALNVGRHVGEPSPTS